MGTKTIFSALAGLVLALIASQPASALIKDKQIFSGITLDAGWDALNRPYSARWGGEFWVGNDTHKFRLKTEGEVHGGAVEEAELQFLYGRRLMQFWELQAGIRYDLKPLGRTFGVIGIEGVLPYEIEFEAALFVDHRGHVSARVEAEHDLQVTQKLVVTPFVELNFAATDTRRYGVGAGLSDLETGIQIRYEIWREFAPFVEFRYSALIGQTGRFARAEGESDHSYAFLIGIRFSF